jgi:SagB-type dehydrogenase family enzyme
MPRPFTLTLRRDIVRTTLPGGLRLVSRSVELTLPPLSTSLSEAFDLLCSSGATKSRLAETAHAAGGEMEVLQLEGMLGALDRAAMLCRTAGPARNPWATLTPSTQAFRFSPQPAPPCTRYRLSRFALLRREGSVMVLESPLAPAGIVVGDWRAAAAIALLANDAGAAELHAAIPGAELEDVEAFLLLLEAAEMVARVNAGGVLAEDENPDLIPWEFHDLFFHARARSGRHDAKVGATFRFRDRAILPPVVRPPVVKDPMHGEKVSLDRPESNALPSPEPPLRQVLDLRRSIRRFGNQPITVSQVGEFLFRSARVVDANPKAGWPKRPYPSGGACYELECYLAVKKCSGLAAGLYHYQPFDHDLTRLPAPEQDVAELLRDAWRAAAREDDPQVLVILAARFGRVAVKYESIGYAVILKNTGVLLQTMHLVATSLGLAGCPLGCGNSDLFAQATGLNYYEEGSVGEFLLGSLP